MKNIQLVLIIAILILIYLISMQWLGRNDDQGKDTQKVSVTYEAPKTISSFTTQESVTTEGVTEEIIPTTLAPEETTATDPNLIEYRNNNYGYHLSLPKKMYYAGFGSRNGALHTLAIQSDTLPEDFSNATVRVLFYGKKILPELQNTHNNRYEDPNGKYILLLLDNAYSVKIESENLNSPTVQAIQETIGMNS